MGMLFVTVARLIIMMVFFQILVLIIPSVLWPMHTPCRTSSLSSMLSGRGNTGSFPKWKSSAPAFFLDWGVFTMGRRVDLNALFVDILGTTNVYFQPPASLQMAYPCIRYERDNAWTDFADNSPYKRRIRYAVSLIDRNPDSEFFDNIAALPLCVYNRHYAADGLNHDVFNLYY